MPTLLPDWGRARSWFPRECDPDEVQALLDFVNQRAAEAVAQRIAVHWLGQVANTIHGFVVTVLGRPFVTLMFHVPTDKPEVGCSGLANKGAVVEFHGDYSDGEARKRLSSPGELIEILISPETRGPSHLQWARATLRDYLRRHTPAPRLIEDTAFRQGLNRLRKEIAEAMEKVIPIDDLLDELALSLVGDRRLVAFLKCLSEHRLLAERQLVRRLLDQHHDAAQLWTACEDSHERLAPLLLAALPNLVPVESKASTLLGHLGIGKQLSKRLRGELRADQMPKLLERIHGCQDMAFTRRFFQHLAALWSQLPAVDPDYVDSRLNYLFALCQRHAQLDGWKQEGRTALPQRAVYAIAPYQPNGEIVDPDFDEYRYALHVPFDTLRRVLDAIFKALAQTRCRADLHHVIDQLDHVLDWLGNSLDVTIPAGISLARLSHRADIWAEHAELDNIPDLVWPCALAEHQGDWQRLQTEITQAYSITPLTCTENLRLESQEMHHCAAPAYWRPTAEGWTRLFSVRKADGGKYATIELAFRQQWVCRQIKGVHNAEFIHVLEDQDNPLGCLIQALIRFYNEKQPAIYPAVAYETHLYGPAPAPPEMPRFLHWGPDQLNNEYAGIQP